MAQVAQDPQLRHRVEDYLAYLIREWEDLPNVAEEWDSWEDHEQLDFVVEWPICEDRLHQLGRWAEQGLLTTVQRARYDQLSRLVAKHRPMLERLLRD